MSEGCCWSCAKWKGCEHRFYITGGNCGIWKPSKEYTKKQKANKEE